MTLVFADNCWDEKGSAVHDVCDDDRSNDDDEDDWGTVPRNCQIFTMSQNPFMSLYQQIVSHWHAVICFRVPDVLLYSSTNLGGIDLKLMYK